MRLLADGFRYNAWATKRLLEVCREVPDERFRSSEGMYNSLFGIMDHVFVTEMAYLRLLTNVDIDRDFDGIDDMLVAVNEIEARFVDFVGGVDEPGLERMFEIPWFKREFTVGDGLLQVIAHSIEHRADVAGFLTTFGYTTPPIDYIIYLYLRDGGVMPS